MNGKSKKVKLELNDGYLNNHGGDATLNYCGVPLTSLGGMRSAGDCHIKSSTEIYPNPFAAVYKLEFTSIGLSEYTLFSVSDCSYILSGRGET